MTTRDWSLWDRITFWFVGWFGILIIFLFHATIRTLVQGSRKIRDLNTHGQPVIYGFWHNQMMIPVFNQRHRQIRIMISASRDGEYIARVTEILGFHNIRGSSSRRGGEALREMVSALYQGGPNAAFTPDGPRGPRYRVQQGIVLSASLSGCPIVPCGVAANRFWRARSWDRFNVPKPFSTALILIGDPIPIPRDLNPQQIEDYCLLIRRQMMRFQHLARQRVRAFGWREWWQGLPES